MEIIMGIVEFFKVHGVELVSLVTSIIGVASIIVKLTPTQADDAVLGKIIVFIGKWIALNPTPKA